MKAIYALYPDPASAQRAVNFLREVGIDAQDITALSSEPFEEYDLGLQDRRTPMPWLAALGGLIGGISGFLLAATTQKAYPLPTGGMPIVSLWPNGIITYELTMLGAIVATLLTLLATAQLPDWPHWPKRKDQLYDPEISDGKILIGVVNPPEGSRVEMEARLRQAGADQVKELGPPSNAIANPQPEGGF